MALHKALPQTKTPEQLGEWINENAIDRRTHTEETPLDDEAKASHREKIANSTAAIYDLKDLEKLFKDSLNNGTKYNGQTREPETFTIPPTKGLKDLEANRQFSDKILKQGFTSVDTPVFGIPYKKETLFFDVEGKLFFSEKAPGRPEGLFDDDGGSAADMFSGESPEA